MEQKRIYLAAPYTSPSAEVREQRFMAVSQRAHQLTLAGHLVFSPITQGHILCAFGGLPCDYAFWEAHCLSFLRHWAQELHVLSLPGWDKSRGVRAEVAEAERMGLPVWNLM